MGPTAGLWAPPLSSSQHISELRVSCGASTFYVSLSLPPHAKVSHLLFPLYQGIFFFSPPSPCFQLPPTPGLLRVFRNHSSLSLLFSGHPGHSPPPRPASGPNRCGQGGESCRTKHVLHKEDLGWGGAFLSFSYIESLWAVSPFPSRGTISLSGSSAGFSITPPFTANRQALGPALKEAPRAKCTQPDMHGLLMHARQAPDRKPPSTSSTQQSL